MRQVYTFYSPELPLKKQQKTYDTLVKEVNKVIKTYLNDIKKDKGIQTSGKH